jgi:tetratricopeptide (TPR) repeat protein
VYKNSQQGDGVISFVGRRLTLDKPSSLIESLGGRSFLLVLVPILLLATVLLEAATSQRTEVGQDEMMQHLVQQMVQVGISQYEHGYYIQAEKTLLMAQAYQEHLSTSDRSKLSSLLEKAHIAALERSRALERAQTASDLAAQGELAKAKVHLEKVKDSEYLTEQERKQIAAFLKEIESQTIKEAPVEKPEGVKPLPEKVEPIVEEVHEKVTEEPEKIAAQLDKVKRAVAQVYYRSMQLYRSGQFEQAREGFVEVVNSGLIPAAMEKTIRGYLSHIDNVLAKKESGVGPSGVTEVPAEKTLPAPTIKWPVEREVIRPEVSKPVAVRPELIRPSVSGAEVGELAAREGGYIEVINRRRNSIRSYTKAVVDDAAGKAQAYMSQGKFDEAKAAVETAEQIVNQNQLDLGDELFKLHSNGLKQLREQIASAKQVKDLALEQQKRKEAIEAQQQFREQMEADRQERIKTLLANAKAYTKQQRYEAALNQLDTLLAIDPLHDEALSLKDMLEDMVFFRQQEQMRKESDKQRADILLKTDESSIPYAEELTYAKNWLEIVQKPTRQPDKPIGLEPADAAVYQQLDEVVDLSQLSPSMPLSEAIEQIKGSVDPPLKIVVLWRDLLDNATIEPTTEINMDGIPAVRLGTALENLLKAVSTGLTELGYVVENGLITIATVDTLPSKMVTRVYDITDLVSEPANFRQMGMMGMGMMGGMGGYGMGGMGGYGMGGMGGYGMGGMGGYGMGGMGGYGGYGGMGGMGGYGTSGYGGYGGTGGGYGGYGGMGGGYGGYGGMGGGYGGYGGGMGGYGGGMGGYGGGMGGYGGGYGGYGGGMGGYGMGGYGMGMGMQDTSQYRAQDLTYLIQDTIEPDSWYDYGGEGTITLYPRGQMPKKLAVLQTREVHADIEKLLAELRKALGYQVSLECRFLIVGENFLEDVGLDIDFSYNLGGKWGLVTVDQSSELASRADTATKVPGSLGGLTAAGTVSGGYGSILDDLQVSFLLRMTQAHTDARALTAPKVTVLSGESATFQSQSQVSYALPPDVLRSVSRGYYAGGGLENLGIQQNVYFVPVGSSLTITPTITPDKKNVLLNIMTQMQDLLRMRTHTVAAIVNTDTDQSQVVEYPVTVPETETSQVMTRVSVPDGGTLLLGGQKVTAEVEKEAGLPVLSKIPGIGRLFSNRSKIKDHKILLILVKPTIILQEEREAEAVAAMENAL